LAHDIVASASSVDWWALGFAVTATVAAVIAALWGWVDRPRYLWWYHTSREGFGWQPMECGGERLARISRDEQHEQEIEVRNVGTAPMYEATPIPVGASFTGKADDRRDWSPMLSMDSEPLTVKVNVPAVAEHPDAVYLELQWIRPLPLTHCGHRLNLRTLEQAVWRWHWWSLLPRIRPGTRWWQVWQFRLTRVSGRWVPWLRAPLAAIPTLGRQRSS
jgi:hypothetical protein